MKLGKWYCNSVHLDTTGPAKTNGPTCNATPPAPFTTQILACTGKFPSALSPKTFSWPFQLDVFRLRAEVNLHAN
ncbi:hypothetical protein BJV78DRAFT_1188975 [Lactifluus subvellereus]|nr:hypothetical protein BJV78DRAFT_1188975 [Lactifluus subvellereus]